MIQINLSQNLMSFSILIGQTKKIKNYQYSKTHYTLSNWIQIDSDYYEPESYYVLV